MRTSRGLRITSIIVAFPVLLILSSLILILALAIQTQLKNWAIQHQPTILTSPPISRLASAALVLSPKPITRRLRLKRFLPSTVWSWLGVLTVFALITAQKLDLVSCSQKAYAFITPPPTHSSTADDDDDCASNTSDPLSSSDSIPPTATSPEEPVSSPQTSALKTPRRKKVKTKHRASNNAQKIALHSPSSQQRRRQLDGVRAQPITTTTTTSVPEDTITCCGSSSSSSSSSSEEEDASEWISVGEKKKKTTKHHYPPQGYYYEHHPQHQDDVLPKVPVMGHVSEEKVDHRQQQPVIRNWYSPFSTGLDLDIMPPRNKQDDQQNWRMDPFYQHAPFFQEQPFSFFEHTMRG